MSGAVHVEKCDQLLDLKKMVFTPRPITASFLHPLSWESEKKVEGISISPPPFFSVSNNPRP
jgi:hypothetical protein